MNAHTPPDNSFVPEIETSLLGALMMGCDAKRVFSIVEGRHFVDGPHQIIFEAIKAGIDRYGSANPVTVCRLVPDGFAESFAMKNDGLRLSSYLAKLCADATGRPEDSAKHVVEQWARHEVLREGEAMIAAASDPASDVKDIGRTVAKNIDDILAEVRAGPARKTRVSLSEASSIALQAARDAIERGHGLAGITYGLADVNRKTGGLHKKDLTLLAARPSMGKTSVALSCAIKAAKSGAGIGFVSLEMDSDKLGARAISDIAYDWNVKIPYADLIRGSVSLADVESIEAATQDIGNMPLWIVDQSGMTINDIRVKAEVMAEDAVQNGSRLDVLFVDHIGLIKPSSRYSGNRTNEIGEITAALKSLARELDIAVVALSQLNRAVESRPIKDRRPQLSDLRDSGAIEQDADTIIFLFREAYYLEREKGGSADEQAARTDRLIDCQHTLEFAIAKQRNGPVTSIDLFADMPFSAVRNGVQR